MSHISFTTKDLAAMVIALIAGICWTHYFLWSIITLALLTSLTVVEKKTALKIVVLCCFFFFGISRYHQHRQSFFNDHKLLHRPCNATAIVTEILPRLDEQEQICIKLRVTNIESDKARNPVDKNVYLFLPHYIKIWLKPHQKITLKNIMFKHPAHNSSYQEYLIRESIWAIAHEKKLFYTTLQKPSLLLQLINELCLLPLQKTNRNFSELTHSLYLSIFCGKKIKSQANTSIKRLFQYWGISHQLARSGLHLIILIGLLLFFLSFLPCKAYKKEWLVIIILSFYYVTTYSSIGFMRAFFMYVLYWICKQLNLASKPTHIFLVTTFFILITNPYHLFFLDFQLSFIITLTILWFFQLSQKSKTIAS